MTDIEKFNADCDAIEAHIDARQAEIAKLRGFANGAATYAELSAAEAAAWEAGAAARTAELSAARSAVMAAARAAQEKRLRELCAEVEEAMFCGERA